MIAKIIKCLILTILIFIGIFMLLMFIGLLKDMIGETAVMLIFFSIVIFGTVFSLDYIFLKRRKNMYIVEIIDPEKAELVYKSEVFSTQKEAEEYIHEVCEDMNGLEGIIVSVLLEKAIFNNRMILTSADIVYHT